MTNKKLKLAAMSVALTACVAAQPMAPMLWKAISGAGRARPCGR